MQQRLPSQLNRTIAFAHRGAKAHAPENTLEAFHLAIKLGATGLESDVWLTADGVPICEHDGMVRVGVRKVPVGKMRRESLPTTVPTVAELLTVAAAAAVDVSLDMKDVEAAASVVAAARAVAFPLERLYLCWNDWTKAAAFKASHASVRVVDSTRLTRLSKGPERRAAELSDAGVDVVNMHYTDWTGGLTTLFHRFGVLTFAWDLQQDRLLRSVIRMGIDGVFSDWVDRMVEAVDDELGPV